MQKYKDFWKLIVTLVKKKDVFHHASAITFNLVICAIPFVLLLIAIIGYVLSYEAAFREVVRYGQEIFPTFTYQSTPNSVFEGVITVETLLQPLINARRVFGLVGLIVLIIFSLGLIHSTKHVIFDIFEIKERKHPLLEIVHNFFTFGLIGGVFVFFSIALSIYSVLSIENIALPFTDKVLGLTWLNSMLSTLMPPLLTLLVFYILYRYISEKHIKRRVALLGAGVYTLLFGLAKFGIGLYLNYAFASYQYFYQGYTVLVIIGFWAFYSSVLFVITTIIARAFQDIFIQQKFKENPYTSIS